MRKDKRVSSFWNVRWRNDQGFEWTIRLKARSRGEAHTRAYNKLEREVDAHNIEEVGICKITKETPLETALKEVLIAADNAANAESNFLSAGRRWLQLTEKEETYEEVV